MAFLDNLSESQREAVVYNDGPHLIIAGAGSGKTRVLTYKIAYLLSQGVSAGNILALTFTNKAAREMRERIGKLVGNDYARYLSMGTFHSIFSRILRQEAAVLGYNSDYTIYDTTDSKSLLKQIIKEMDLDEKIYKVGDVLGRISDAKNNLVSPRSYASDRDYTMRDKLSRMYRMADVYYTYQKRLFEANAMDFDDLLVNMYKMLDQFPDLRDKYQQIFKYILVDEYQDTNHVQYLIVKYLAEPNCNICVVGDDAQSIYSFRGADIRNILEFQDDYKGCPLFKLERNYRSTQNIVNAANSLIKHNRRQISKDVYSENGVGLPLQLSTHGSDRDEGKFLAEKAYMLHRLGRDYDDIAVLYRTNAQSRVIEDELRKLSIPYRIYGGVSFYQRKEIKDVLAYFRLVCNPKDDEALLRIINFPSRGIGDTTMKRVKELAHGQGVNLMEVVSRPMECGLQVTAATQKKLIQFSLLIEKLREQLDEKNAYDFADYVLRETGIRTSLSLDKTQEGIDRQENVEELMSAIREFVEMQLQSGLGEVSIRAFLAEVALLTDQDENSPENDSRMTLMTIHSAKGLEYGVVMIAGLEENLFPSMFCERESEIEEERRLFYVAITRAKEECYITSCNTRYKNGQLQFQSPSRFLKDLDPRFVQRIQSAPQRSTDWSSRGFDDDSFGSRNYGSERRYQGEFGASYSRPLKPANDFPAEQARRTASAPSPSRLKPTTGLQPKGEKKTITTAYPIGSRVRHSKFGDGTVEEAFLENGNDKVVINFDTAGRKTMLLTYAKLERI